MDWVGNVWDFLFALSSGAWSAVATWLAVAVATTTIVVTGLYAKKQVEAAQAQLGAANEQIEQAKLQLKEAEKTRESQEQQAQQLREEQAQPNVVIFTEPDATHFGHLDLVVKNFGATPAFDVTMHFSPEPNVSEYENLTTGETVTTLAYPTKIPFLAPGQEWRTSWDDASSRTDDNRERAKRGEPPLVSLFDAVARFADSRGKEFETASVLDWGYLEHTMKVSTKTIHHVAKTLDERLKKTNEILLEIGKVAAKYSSEGTGVWVYVGDAQQLRDSRAAEQARNAEQMASLQRRLFPNQTAVQPSPSDSTPPDDPDQGEPEPPQSEGE